MNKIKLVAVDLAKRCYQVGAIDEHGKVRDNREVLAGEVCTCHAAARADQRSRWKPARRRTTGAVA